MKYFWVLGWDQYYPASGLGNVRGTFLTKEEAEEFLMDIARDYDRTEVVDIRDYYL